MVTKAHGCERLAEGRYSTARGRDSNSRPLSHQSDALATRLSSHPTQRAVDTNYRFMSQRPGLNADSGSIRVSGSWLGLACESSQNR